MHPLEELLLLEKSKIPLGVKFLTFIVNDTVKEVKISPPWMSFGISNTSMTHGLKIAVNTSENILNDTVIEAEGYLDIKLDYPIIHNIFMQAESGGTITVRIYGVEGLWRTSD